MKQGVIIIIIGVLILAGITTLTDSCTNSKVQEAQTKQQVAEQKLQVVEQNCEEAKAQLIKSQTDLGDCAKEREDWHVKYTELKSSTKTSGIAFIIVDVLIGIALMFWAKSLDDIEGNPYFWIASGLLVIGIVIALFMLKVF